MIKGEQIFSFRSLVLLTIAVISGIVFSCNKNHSDTEIEQRALTPEQQAVQKAKDWLEKNHLLQKVNNISVDNISVATDFNNRSVTTGKVSENAFRLPGTGTGIPATPINPAVPPLTTKPEAPAKGFIKWDNPMLINRGCKPMLAVPYKIEHKDLTAGSGDLPVSIDLIVKDLGNGDYQVARKISTTVIEPTSENTFGTTGLTIYKPVTYEYYFDLNGNLIEAWRRNFLNVYQYIDLSARDGEPAISVTCAGTITIPTVAMKGCDGVTSTCTFVYGSRTIGQCRLADDWGDPCKRFGGGIPSGGGPGFSTPTPSPTKDSIGFNLQNLCLVNAMKFVNDADCKNVFQSILERWDFFERYQVSIKESSAMPDTTMGWTTGGKSGSGEFSKIYITLNSNKLPYASYEYVTATIMHEVVHGYLKEIKQVKFIDLNMVKDDHNNFSTYDCVGWMKDALKEIFPYLSDREALALAWGGLESTTDYQKLPAADQTDFKNINYAHATGKKGITCH